MNVICVGLLPSTFLLITKDFYVFDLSPTALKGDDSSSKLYLGTKPVAIEEKWPTLASDPRFIDIKGKVFNAFTVRDSESEYVLFNTKGKKGSKGISPGVVYDMRNDKVHPGFAFSGDLKQAMIASSKEMIFYAISAINNSKGLEISEYRFGGKTLFGSKRDM